ncbi:Amidase 1 [Platanthera zijinensis]|uniref:Amidase 1 n=1 Tax=Platanthera zijinensis TaxID=2320716 RepID=A0AAP0B9H5_9ASPA
MLCRSKLLDEASKVYERSQLDQSSQSIRNEELTSFNESRDKRSQERCNYGVLAIPTVPGPPPKLNQDSTTLEDFRAKAFSLLAVTGLFGFCQEAGEKRAADTPTGREEASVRDPKRCLVILHAGVNISCVEVRIPRVVLVI